MALPPGHIAVGEATAVMVGPGSTETVATAELVQLPLAATTVYIVVTVGLTTTRFPTKAPGNQVYERAPRADANKFDEPPIHILEGDAMVTKLVGVGTTAIFILAVAEHPTPVDPNTV